MTLASSLKQPVQKTDPEISQRLSREQGWLADCGRENLIAQIWALDPARFNDYPFCVVMNVHRPFPWMIRENAPPQLYRVPFSSQMNQQMPVQEIIDQITDWMSQAKRQHPSVMQMLLVDASRDMATVDLFHTAGYPAIPIVMTGGSVVGTNNYYNTPDWEKSGRMRRAVYITASKSVLDGAVSEVIRRKIIHAVRSDVSGDWRIIQREMQSYLKPDNPTSRQGGAAAPGQHDDSVSALSMAVLGSRMMDSTNALSRVGRVYIPRLINRGVSEPEVVPPSGSWC